MADVIIMPKLGFNMDEGKLVKWYKNEGDKITKGEPLFSVETDKTAIDIEATRDGVLHKTLIEEGDAVQVTLPIAVVGDEGEDVAAVVADATKQLKAGLGEEEAEEVAASPAPAEEKVAKAEPAKAKSDGAKGFDFDVIVIGGGPGGYVAAIKAAQLGKKTALIEKDTVGGVCLNRGCIPTKTFLRSAEALKEVKGCSNFGIIDAETSNAKLDMKALQKRKKGIISQLVAGVEGLLRGNGVTKFQGEGVIKDKNTVVVGDKTITGEYLIIATGSDIDSMNVPIDPAMKVFNSDDILELDYIPENMVVLGGGVIAIEFAYFLASVGCKVTVIVRSRILRTATDKEVGAQVADHLRKMGIDVYEAAAVKEVTKDAVVFEKDGKLEEVKTANVLIATGRTPSLKGVPCDELGIKLDSKGAIVTDEHMRTSVDNIYAIGDVNGKAMLAHVASMEGIVAVENICGKNTVMEYDKIPSCIYIQPEIASAGLTEDEAREKYGEIKVGKFPMLANGKSKVAGDERGFIKVIAEAKYNEIVGVHLYCLHATDMIAEAVLGMKLESTLDEAAMAIHPHPTVSEVFHEAFNAALDKAIHFL
ncbi:MAG: dihydrolipoyl dehydrogenase [Clostridiales bacterium]|nr:dihydrolipoyl dehydrogenase [Clostridiales bacterium]